MKFAIVACLAILLGSLSVGGEPFENQSAVRADADYEASVAKALSDCKDALEQARVIYVAALKSAQDEETKAAKLDSAVQIRDAIAELKTPRSVALTQPAPSGIVNIRYADKMLRRFQIKGTSVLHDSLTLINGKTQPENVRAKLEPEGDGSYRLTYAEGKAYEIWTVTPRKTFVERWVNDKFECLGVSE